MASERPPEVKNVTEYPELGMTGRPGVPHKTLNTDYPVRFTSYDQVVNAFDTFTNSMLYYSSSTPTHTSNV